MNADTVHASFAPELKVTVLDPTPEANSNFTGDFNVPTGDVNFGPVISFIPTDWGIAPGSDAAIGAVVGNLTSTATLGLINSPCNNPLPVEFIMLNSSTDPTDTVAFADSDDNDTQDFAEDKNDNGIRDGIEKYPEFITRVLDDADGNPLVPLRRSAGISQVAGINVLLQFLVFDPGTVIDAALPSDADLGYPSVTLLQNIGDPDVVPAPSVITDFCTPLVSSNTSLGVSADNPDTDADESGAILLTNPLDGKYTFTTIALGQRDADGDSYENALDTCALDTNEGDPRVLNDGDNDGDGLDAACDPDDDSSNSDEDLDGYQNRGDNCSLEANGQPVDPDNPAPTETNQADGDGDGVGDACDPNPDDSDAQGTYAAAQPTFEVTIGTGTGPGGPAGAGDDDGNTTLIIIIVVVVVVAVIVIGGGALYMRRSRG
jgi:hypothetical protein